MGMIENDPRDIGYAALFRAITWYKQIPPDAALRIAHGKSSAKPGVKVTPEIRRQIMKLTENPNFRTFNGIEKKFKINRFDIITREEDIVMSKANVILKGLKEGLDELRKLSENCIASNCEDCFLNNVFGDNKTFCDMLIAIEIDEQGKPVYSQKRQLQQIVKSYNLSGRPKLKTFQFHGNALEKFEEYLKQHEDIKKRDIMSVAVLEYMERHK